MQINRNRKVQGSSDEPFHIEKKKQPNGPTICNVIRGEYIDVKEDIVVEIEEKTPKAIAKKTKK